MRIAFLPLTLLLVHHGDVLGQDSFLKIDAEETTHLGIRTVVPEHVSAIPLAEAPGRVVLPPAKEFAVSAFQSGIITHVDVPLGVKVAKGQILAEINSVTLLESERALVEANATFGVADSRLRRDNMLLAEGVISKLRWQETQSDFERSQAALRAAEQTLISSGITQAEVAALKSGHQIGGIYRLVSPVDGVVLDRTAVVGQRVEALSPLFRIGKLDEIWLEVDVPQERLKEVGINDRIEIEAPKAGARIIEIGQNVDPRSQSALVRALVDRGADQLRPGMHVSVLMMHKSTDRGFKVPVSAIFSFEGKSYVFVQNSVGYEAREVAIAGEETYSTVLHEGLQEGEAVVVQGVAALKAAWLGMSGGG